MSYQCVQLSLTAHKYIWEFMITNSYCCAYEKCLVLYLFASFSSIQNDETM